jgi:hypothetical protein
MYKDITADPRNLARLLSNAGQDHHSDSEEEHKDSVPVAEPMMPV